MILDFCGVSSGSPLLSISERTSIGESSSNYSVFDGGFAGSSILKILTRYLLKKIITTIKRSKINAFLFGFININY